MIISRRNVLRGAGVTLALPWLESLAPRVARAQALAPRRRFVAIYFPDGAVTSWSPTSVGTGSAWQPSPVMAPLAAVKPYATVLSHVDNYAPFGGHVEPSNGYTTGAFLTCANAKTGSLSLVQPYCGTSVDQVLARGTTGTPIDSLQLGLTIQDDFCDGAPCACARSISWASPTQPLYKVVSPQAVFDRLVGTSPDGGVVLARSGDKSVLDYVLGHATSVQQRLSRSDRARMDQFMTSVRSVETSIQSSMASCMIIPRPTQAYTDTGQSSGSDPLPPGYDRDLHANIMIDLMVMALQCDLTRVITHMMEDARSFFPYTFLNLRQFTATGSTVTTTPITYGSYSANASGDNFDGFATINYWFVEKLVRLCQKMLGVDEGPNGTLLDQSVVFMSSNFHGSNHDARDLPLIYVGSGGGRLKVDAHIDFSTNAGGGEELHNVYFTLLQKVFDLPVPSFGTGPTTGSYSGSPAVYTVMPGPALPSSIVSEILA